MAGSSGTSWSFKADLAGDGCVRWLVRLVDADGGSARFASAAVLRDTTDPRAPSVRAAGSRAWQRVPDGTIWVRAGRGALVLTADGVDAGSGVTGHRFGALTVPAGWSSDVGPIEDEATEAVLRWRPGARSTSLTVRATDAVGRTGTRRTVVLRLDASNPRASGWRFPRSGTTGVTGDVPSLVWRAVSDTRIRCGPAPARPAADGVTPARLLPPRRLA